MCPAPTATAKGMTKAQQRKTKKKPSKKRGRGRPPKTEDERSKVRSVSVPLPEAMIKEIEAFTKALGEHKYCTVSRNEAMRELLSHALRSWRKKKQTDTDSDPSLFI